MKNNSSNTPIRANYRILSLIEQIVEIAPKGTDLALCDLISAMLSGYFIESRGAVMPAVEAYLRQEIKEEKERNRRSRRAAKVLAYGSYNLVGLIKKIEEIVKKEGQWEATRIQGYRIAPVDFTGYQRGEVEKLKTKAYDSNTGKAIPAVSIGMIGSVGEVNGQRMAFLKKAIVADIKSNDHKADEKKLYKEVAESLSADEISVFDAGFKLLSAVEAGIERCVVRLAKNSTFGKTPGKIPERTSQKGPDPSQYKAEIVRPLERTHGENTISATPADRLESMTDKAGNIITLHIWEKLYFLERHLKNVPINQKEPLRHLPFQVTAVYHPSYNDPLLIATPLLELKPQSHYEIYLNRWPIEGLPQTGKYILSGGGGRHFVHHPLAIERLPVLSLICGSLLKYVAATLPPFRTGFWDRQPKPTYGRLLRHLKKVGIRLSQQLFKKESVTAHLPIGYKAVSLSNP